MKEKKHVHMLDLDRPSRPRIRKSACKDCVAREAERNAYRAALERAWNRLRLDEDPISIEREIASVLWPRGEALNPGGTDGE